MRPFKSERLRVELRLSTRFLLRRPCRSVASFNRSLKDQVLDKASLPRAVNANFYKSAHVVLTEVPGKLRGLSWRAAHCHYLGIGDLGQIWSTHEADTTRTARGGPRSNIAVSPHHALPHFSLREVRKGSDTLRPHETYS